jgi:hypothetical protein
MSNITGARKPLEINEIRLIAMDALTAFLRSRHTYPMNTHELPDMIIKAGFARGKLPRNASDVDGLTERRILDVIGRLLNEGIITWGGSIGAGLFSTDNISITEHGEKILLEEDTPGQHDPIVSQKDSLPYAPLQQVDKLYFNSRLPQLASKNRRNPRLII